MIEAKVLVLLGTRSSSAKAIAGEDPLSEGRIVAHPRKKPPAVGPDTFMDATQSPSGCLPPGGRFDNKLYPGYFACFPTCPNS